MAALSSCSRCSSNHDSTPRTAGDREPSPGTYERISELYGWPGTFIGNIGFEAMDGNVPGRPDLSRKENELLRLLADGMSTRQIAVELKISERSAQVLIPKILRKLGRGPDLGEPPGSDV